MHDYPAKKLDVKFTFIPITLGGTALRRPVQVGIAAGLRSRKVMTDDAAN
jgi:uncharacterized protein YqfA (UPF0365 family)